MSYEELKAWKESATAVLNGIDLQSVGKQLGLPLGSDIGPAILPSIKRLQAENEKLRTGMSDQPKVRGSL